MATKAHQTEDGPSRIMTALPRTPAPAREAPNPERALGSNIAGAVLGGLAESCSAVLGFQYLLFVAIGFYLFSAWLPRLQRDPA